MDVLLKYLAAAMQKAHYDFVAEDGTYVGEIPGFRGVFASGTTKEACEVALRRVLEEWVLFRALKNHPLPTVDGIRIENRELEGEALLLSRFHRLEENLEEIKLHLGLPMRQSMFTYKLSRFNSLFNSYWVLASFISALLILGYVYYAFGVDYFEDYRKLATTRSSAEFYRKLGDQMLSRAEFKSAEEAYQEALKINPNNLAATQGILRTQVLEPLKGEKYYRPEVVEAKLNHLMTILGQDDYLIHYYRGILHSDQYEYDEAKRAFGKTIASKPDFVAAYNMFGTTNLQAQDDIGEAISNFSKALEVDPNYAVTHLNLGRSYLLTEDFDRAIEHLARSKKLSPQAEAALMLGDAYLYKGDDDSVSNARREHEYALTILENKTENDNYVSSFSIFNYMPTRPGDRETIRHYVYTNGDKQSKAFVHYALSFDHALMKKFKEADKEFNSAYELESGSDYKTYFQYKVLSLMGFVKMDPEVKSWFETKSNAKLAAQ